MDPKPAVWGPAYSAAFRELSVVDRYHLRPSYPAETFDVLASLTEGRPVLEAGCGLGELARGLAPQVPRVDAVDISAPMVERGRQLPGGDAANLRWTVAAIEDAALEPPYGLVVAGESIHWFDWAVAFSRFESLLEPEGSLALVYRNWLHEERFREQLRPIYRRHSSNPDYRRLDAVEELERRGLFEQRGKHTTAPVAWRPTLEELLAAHHSTSGFVLERQSDPEAFDAELGTALRDMLEERDGRLELEVTAGITWGRPRGPRP
jgi:SAM-dependent methyltransferase